MGKNILILSAILFLRIFIAPAWLSATTTGNCGLDDDTLFHLVTLHKRRVTCDDHSETNEFVSLPQTSAIEHVSVQIRIKNFIAAFFPKFFFPQFNFYFTCYQAEDSLKKYLLLRVLRI